MKNWMSAAKLSSMKIFDEMNVTVVTPRRNKFMDRVCMISFLVVSGLILFILVMKFCF